MDALYPYNAAARLPLNNNENTFHLHTLFPHERVGELVKALLTLLCQKEIF